MRAYNFFSFFFHLILHTPFVAHRLVRLLDDHNRIVQTLNSVFRTTDGTISHAYADQIDLISHLLIDWKKHMFS